MIRFHRIAAGNPEIRSFWNSRQQAGQRKDYEDKATEEFERIYEKLLAEADAYNEELGTYGISWSRQTFRNCRLNRDRITVPY